MPRFNRDKVRVVLDGRETILAERYSVHSSVLEVPAGFSITISQDTAPANFAAEFPEWTPFELFVGDVRVQHGETDGYQLNGGDAASGTNIVLPGRDLISRLVETEIENERTFAEKSYADLTRIALDEVGLQSETIIASDDARKLAISGSTTVKEATGESTESTQTEVSRDENTASKVVRNTIRAEVGTTWFQFLLEQYRKRGLFLWSRDVGFLLSEPNKDVTPSYRLVRKRDGRQNDILSHDFARDGKRRYSECVVHGRTGGGKKGRTKATGRFVDDEATALLGGRQKKRVIYDKKVQTTEDAEFIARREIAKSRRDGWSLSYKVAGHSARTIDGNIWFPWLPDSVVEVHDEELGLFGNMYIQAVEYSGEPQTITTLKLMRVEDMFFAEQVPSTGKSKRVGKGLQGIKVDGKDRPAGVTTIERVFRSASGRVVLMEDND